MANEVASKPTIRLGDEGIFVSNLQTLLYTLGYLRSDNITGTFDYPTEHAVKTFQADKGLLIDGIVGPETWAAIENAVKGEKLPTDIEKVWEWIKAHKVLTGVLAGGTILGIYLIMRK